MTCREFIEFLWQYLSEELSPAERATFAEHLARCSPCVRYLKSYEDTIKLGKAGFTHPEDPVPTNVPEELIQAILSARVTRA
jgi:anti-sigma factor RsiW